MRATALLSLTLLLGLPSCGQDAPTTVPADDGKTQEWIRRLDDSIPAVRAEAAEHVQAEARRKPDAWRGAVDPLVKLLQDPDPSLRASAARGLGALGRTARSAAMALAVAVRDSREPEVRAEGIDALSRVAAPPGAYEEAVFGRRDLAVTSAGRPAPEAVQASDLGLQASLAALSDDDPEVRVAALGAIERWGHEASHLASRVAPFLKDPDDRTRYVALFTYRHIGGPGAPVVDDLAALVGRGKTATRVAAVRFLRDIGEPASRVVPLLERFREDPEIGPAVVEALAVLTPKED